MSNLSSASHRPMSPVPPFAARKTRSSSDKATKAFCVHVPSLAAPSELAGKLARF
eukprot:CAMPEP_0117468802 /NCGR_PEP_ID=MMETSP0784-20121206/6366_1 /TAXON_ID=39447 /ORGANISM="" /LENGTH=54 /DNA_ID=CAMNT_0005262827 /DNA_START=244 /DNA_END=408 /DNA_ORIENTATION=+